MIQKLQQLRAKKGFTLVELVVVIAIIGVLSAILVPVMMNWAESARIASANSSAATIKNTYNNYSTEQAMNNAGFGSSSFIILATKESGNVKHTTVKTTDSIVADGDFYNDVLILADTAKQAALEDSLKDVEIGAKWVMVVENGSVSNVFYSVAATANVFDFLQIEGASPSTSAYTTNLPILTSLANGNSDTNDAQYWSALAKLHTATQTSALVGTAPEVKTLNPSA